jgi:hypothetical protein
MFRAESCTKRRNGPADWLKPDMATDFLLPKARRAKKAFQAGSKIESDVTTGGHPEAVQPAFRPKLFIAPSEALASRSTRHHLFLFAAAQRWFTTTQSFQLILFDITEVETFFASPNP